MGFYSEYIFPLILANPAERRRLRQEVTGIRAHPKRISFFIILLDFFEGSDIERQRFKTFWFKGELNATS